MINFLDGNEAIARAAVHAGCDFFAGYPITPATSIFHHMLQLLPPSGGVCMQGEDEIGSIGFCLGASMGGAMAMTATSGPGISLFSEHISFAIGSEIPIVIVDVQRLGPSTGSATKGADGDIQFLRWGNSGGLPVIVLAPVDVRDCYILTSHAFNLAETYRCPVFIASNKEIGMTRESIIVEDIDLPESRKRQTAPRLLPMQKGSELSRLTSSTHGPDGYITADTGQIENRIKHLQDKFQNSGVDFCYYNFDEQVDSTLLLITYGVTARAATDAVSTLRTQGEKVSLLVLKTLYPVGRDIISYALDGKEKILVIEMNCGQYVREIERIAANKSIQFLGRMNGELITPSQILEVLQS
ncbi:pyruvate flavodoxin/ferredoxin oxidoreductase [Desulfopila sp. IMCC35008]|uniref:pyruvate flavodoxin/ferredoxin oxidoreductase n=1 Tax=Desulfopila sp. IMCC35008 TaxID=2653858 RepID=UPI0013D6B0BA|nr:pyruvate flavodoxin/ferredoxin oxidoreductase [Desulfopila sp. IMCC35008]